MRSEIDLLVVGGTVGGIAAKAAAAHIPVVFISVGAPVDIGLVKSLAHPGGNMTGTTFEATSETYAKRLQLLNEVLPRLSRVSVLGASDGTKFPICEMQSLEQSAQALHVSINPIQFSAAGDLGNAFNEMKAARSEGLIVVSELAHLLKPHCYCGPCLGAGTAVLSRLSGGRRRRWTDQPWSRPACFGPTKCTPGR